MVRIPLFLLSMLFALFPRSCVFFIDTTQREPEMSIDEIWAIEDPYDLVIEMSSYIVEKCDYGEDMAALSEVERIFYVTQCVEMEVNNGGFAQYFFNSAGDRHAEIVAAYTAIGAEKTAALCQKALDAFGAPLPEEREARIDFMEACPEKVYELLSECDHVFFAYEEDLSALSYAFIMNHKDSFT